MSAWPFNILPLIERLAQDKPITSGLLVGDDCRQGDWPADWQHCPHAELLSLPFEQRYDLAVLNLSDGLDRADTVQGLTKLRDLLARRVLVIVTAQALHDLLEQLHALGFSQLDSPADGNTNGNATSDPNSEPTWQIWQFNILAYKQVPDWLNTRFWANPENFDKYRW